MQSEDDLQDLDACGLIKKCVPCCGLQSAMNIVQFLLHKTHYYDLRAAGAVLLLALLLYVLSRALLILQPSITAPTHSHGSKGIA